MDIKNTLEVIEALKVLGVSGKDIAKDGLKADDLPKVVVLAQKHKVFTDAVEGVSDIPAELKDIDMAEAVQVGMAFIGALKAIKES